MYWHRFKNSLGKIKRQVWNKRILLWWYRLWLRKDEFHNSLTMDTAALKEMTPEEQKEYCDDLAKRRQLAHERDLD